MSPTLGVEPTELCSHAPNPARVGLADFQVQSNPDGVPQQITCPQGQCLPVTPGRRPQWYAARFEPVVCQACPLQVRCPSQVRQSNLWRAFRFSQRQLDVAQRRQRSATYQQARKHLRAAVEATIGALKRPFSDDQLLARGQFRVGVMMIGSALMVNVHRIQRYLVEKDVQQQQTQLVMETKEPQRTSLSSSLSAMWNRLSDLYGSRQAAQALSRSNIQYSPRSPVFKAVVPIAIKNGMGARQSHSALNIARETCHSVISNNRAKKTAKGKKRRTTISQRLEYWTACLIATSKFPLIKSMTTSRH